MTIFFKSDGHRARFIQIMNQLGRINRDGKYDQEYGSALYILTADSGTWSRAREYIDDEGIDFDLMLDSTDFSSGYNRLVRLAGNLFNSGQHIEPVEICTGVDTANFLVALTAMQMRRDAISASEIEETGK